jgi:hypothetical protein
LFEGKKKKTLVVHREGSKCPPENEVKINIDAAFNSEYNHGGVGVIIRENKGCCIAACQTIDHICMVEAYTLREGLVPSQFIGCNRIIMQSD